MINVKISLMNKRAIDIKEFLFSNTREHMLLTVGIERSLEIQSIICSQVWPRSRQWAEKGKL